MMVVMGVFGPGGLAALLLMPTRPVSHILLSVPIIPVRVALLRPVITCMSRGVCMSRLAERSPGARLALLRPASILSSSCSSGGVMMVSAVAPVVPWSVVGPAVRSG